MSGNETGTVCLGMRLGLCLGMRLGLIVCIQQKEKVLQKAKKTHKQRVEVRNRILCMQSAIHVSHVMHRVMSTGFEPVLGHSH